MPAGEIDSFHYLLHGLTENGLLNRISQTGPPVVILPGRNELDLRYSISMKEIQHLKDVGMIRTSIKQPLTPVPELTKNEVFGYL